MELCQQCTGSCGKLAHGYMIPQKDMGGLPFGSVLGAGTPAYCVDSFCVPKAVRDPWGLCTAVQQDSTLLHGMKRRLMSAVRPFVNACSQPCSVAEHHMLNASAACYCCCCCYRRLLLQSVSLQC